MKQILSTLVIGLLLVGHSQGSCRVACHQQAVVAAVVENIVAVPVAVPVGIPVASNPGYYYSYNPPPTVNVTIDTNSIADAVISRLNPNQNPGPLRAEAKSLTAPAPPVAQTAVSAKCARCHSGETAKGGLNLSNLALLDCPTRMRAARAVLQERMPKDGKLTAEEAGQVLTELTADK